MLKRWTFRAVVCSIPLIILGIISAAAPPSPVPSPTVKSQETASPDPLLELNGASRSMYRRAKEFALSQSGPIILVEGDNLVLRVGTKRDEVRVVPEIYHNLKSVCHIPLALDVMLASLPNKGRIEDGDLVELSKYRGLIDAARERVAKLGLEREQADRQMKIIAAGLKLIDTVIESRACDRDVRLAFTRQMTPLVLANVDDATRAYLDSLHRHISNWREGMPATEWDRLTVLVMGPQLPRKDNAAVQYFARLLGEPGESRRIVYTEALFNESDALSLLGTALVDTQVGLDFFNDSMRMHRDLLGDAAREYLPKLLGKPVRAAANGER